MADKYCRLCGDFSVTLLNVSATNDSPLHIRYKILTLLHLPISVEDKFSCSICEKCLNSVNQFYEFSKKCSEVQFRLHNIENIIILTSTETENAIGTTELEKCITEEENEEVRIENETSKPELPEPETTVNYEDVSCVIIEDHDIELAPVEKNEISIDGNDSCENIPATRQKQIPYSKLVYFFTSKVKPLSDRKLEETSLKQRIIEEITQSTDIEMEDANRLKVEAPEQENEYEPTDCCESVETKVPISRQVSNEIPEKPEFTMCPLCSHKFVFCEMKDHLNCHATDKDYLKLIIAELVNAPAKHKSNYCKECQKLFVRDSLFVEHLNSHSKLKFLSCHLCDNKFSTRNKLKMHVRSVHVVKSKKCDLCNYASKHLSDLAKHKRSIHGNQYIICEVCGKAVSCNISNYNRHLQTHSEERPYKCDLCDSSYKTAYSLKKHRENSHFPNSVMCTTCGTICGSKMKYKKHLRRCKKKMQRYG